MTPANTLSFPDNLFFTRLQQSAHHLLLLDYDGTLSPFVEDRFKASPYPGVTELLGAILDQPRSRLVIITGRPISEIQPLLNMSPGPEIWGAHGWQRLLPDGTLEQFPLPPETDKILTLVRLKLLEQVPVEKIDVKPGSVAVHWRGLSEEKRRAFSRHARHACSPYQEHKDLALQEFDGGLELRVKGRD
ncbi:hypothetical protein JW933_03910, partial [candidate division FCPU426 bacterium]|nr:hypothetical protein [candidate division FCPU426 bacterium]